MTNNQTYFTRAVMGTRNVTEALKAYREKPSQESAQALFDQIVTESKKRMVPWGEPRKICPHGKDPEECPECKTRDMKAKK
jgi:hypothetical protein